MLRFVKIALLSHCVASDIAISPKVTWPFKTMVFLCYLHHDGIYPGMSLFWFWRDRMVKKAWFAQCTTIHSNNHAILPISHAISCFNIAANCTPKSQCGTGALRHCDWHESSIYWLANIKIQKYSFLLKNVLWKKVSLHLQFLYKSNPQP